MEDSQRILTLTPGGDSGSVQAGFEIGGSGLPSGGGQTWGASHAESLRGIIRANEPPGTRRRPGLETEEKHEQGIPQDNAALPGDLGALEANGCGVAHDNAVKMNRLRQAAALGDADAQNSLGCRYAKGLGVSQDDELAVTWFRQAAEQGNASAQYNLGVMYTKGHGVDPDDKQAVYWCRQAAEKGLAAAQT